MGDERYTMGKELDLKSEQQKTLQTPKLNSNLFLQIFYLAFDVFYGKKRTLPKFLVLEVLARYPYWAWENGSYKALTRLHAHTKPPTPQLVENLLYAIQLGRESQDNEQYHMLLLADIIRQKRISLSWARHFFIPRLMACGYYYFNRVLYFFRPTASFYMNAAFESHAEHEYMLMAQENPEWETEPVESVYFKYYPKQKSLADLLRRIALDERDHMNHSLAAGERFKRWPDKTQGKG